MACWDRVWVLVLSDNGDDIYVIIWVQEFNIMQVKEACHKAWCSAH